MQMAQAAFIQQNMCSFQNVFLTVTSWQNVYDLVKNVYNYVKQAECKTISTLCC